VEERLALGFAAMTGLVIASVYAYAGTSLARRSYEPDARRAGTMFAMWWYGIAATGIVSAAMAIFTLRGASSGLLDILDQVGLTMFTLALSGFVSYLAFIYLGRHTADWVIFPVYGALTTWSFITAAIQPATSYHVEAWRPMFERPVPSYGPSPVLMSILLLVPVVVGIAAYANLRARSQDPHARRRATIVTGALIAWLVGVSIVSLPAMGDSDVAQFAGRAFVFGSAVSLVIAFRPQAVTTEQAAEDALEERLRALI
jgi:hypothetical protein